MKSTYTTKERGRLLQVEHKCCNGFNRDNFKHKLYTHLTSLGRRHQSLPYSIFCDSPWGLHPNGIFFQDSHSRIQKMGFYCPKTLDTHIFLKSNLFGTCKDNILYFLNRSFQQCITIFN